MRISALLNKNNVIKFFLSHFNHSIHSPFDQPPILYNFYITHPFQITNHEANNKTDPDLKFAHPKILLFFNKRKKREKKEEETRRLLPARGARNDCRRSIASRKNGGQRRKRKRKYIRVHCARPRVGSKTKVSSLRARSSVPPARSRE